jgi:hypothetical protein
MSHRYSAAKFARAALCGLLVVAAAGAMTAGPAAARGGGHVFFGFNTWGPSYYYPYYAPYYYPPAYYPPPLVYAPAPAYGTVQPLPPPGYPDSSGRNCREYQTTIQVDGQAQPIHGTACQQPDGTWRMIN